MPRRVPLPPRLAAAPFLVSDGLRQGIGDERLAGPDLQRPFRGVRALHRLDFIGSCRAYALLMTDAHHFSHITAARLWGCPLPEEPGDEPLHVSVASPGRARRGAGVIGHRSTAPVVERLGFRVSDPASTWFALAAMLPLDELVVCGDHLILDPAVLDPLDLRPYMTLEELAERVESFSGRGSRTAASALSLLRQGAESRPETLLRLLLLRAGLPEPELNVDVRDARGRWLGRGDLVFRRWHTIVEYDGDEHRTSSRQYDRDITRSENFVHAGYTVVRVRKHALFGRPEDVVRRVARALESRGWSR